MSVIKNYKQLSGILKQISLRLLDNQNLCKLVYYDDINPLSHADIADTKILFDNQILFKPQAYIQNVTKAKLILLFPSCLKDLSNLEIMELPIDVYVSVPFSTWVIEGDDLRTFMIMSEIESSLDSKEIGGIGRLQSLGFTLYLNTEELAVYKMEFKINVFS